MATIVSAFAVSHAAFMLRAWDTAPQDTRDRVAAGYGEISRRLYASRPDFVFLIGSDHYQSFFIDNMPAFCLGLGNTSTGWGDAGIPSYALAIASEPAQHLVKGLLDRGFDIAYSRDMPLDHAFMTPVHLLMPNADIPVVPLFQNCVAPPLPTIARCMQLGAGLRECLDLLDDNLRVAVIATGGLSHTVPLRDWRASGDSDASGNWLRYVSRGRYQSFPELQTKIQNEMADWGKRGSGRINQVFDREILSLFESAKHAQLATYSYDYIDEHAGNGGQEIRNWATLAGILPDLGTETIFYEPTSAWLTGIAGIAFNLGGV